MPRVYDELHRLASSYLRRERPDHMLGPTALVSEAFLRLVGGGPSSWNDRVHFFAVAARHLRQILVDHARRRTAAKRGGRERPITFDENRVAGDDRPDELVALHDALTAFAKVDERKARVVEMHYFGGMKHDEIAAALGVHVNTVARDLRIAQAWLNRELREG
jgi:RNA polymerase sigma factor (TIGR02999 family)